MSVTLRLRRGENLILAAISAADFEPALPHLDVVRFDIGDVVYEAGARVDFVYFPLDALFSLITVMRDGSRVEATTVGFDGTTGTPLAPMGDLSPVLVTCQLPGEAIRMPVRAFHRWMDTHPPVRHLIGRYAQALLGSVAQTAACNKLHSIEQRCARWLLMTHDRVNGDSFPMTQEFLSAMLGVRRASVTKAALDLQDRGLIRYSRGRMDILDRPGLEAISCECYETVAEQRRLIMGPSRPPLHRE